MGAALIRAALSTNIKDRRDCSTAIYTARGDLVAQADPGQAYYEVDVTDLVLADYLQDGDHPMSAFRLQIDGAVFMDDDQDGRYRFTMPGAEANHPELVLIFIPEPSTLLLVLLALGVVGGWRKWGG